MSIDIKDVEYVASLAKISQDKKDKEDLKAKLENILNYIDKLNEVDTKDVQIYSYYKTQSKNVLREDEQKPSFTNEEITKNAPDVCNGYFRVKKVIE